MILIILGILLILIGFALKVLASPFYTLLIGVGFIIVFIGFLRRLIKSGKVKKEE